MYRHKNGVLTLPGNFVDVDEKVPPNLAEELETAIKNDAVCSSVQNSYSMCFIYDDALLAAARWHDCSEAHSRRRFRGLQSLPNMHHEKFFPKPLMRNYCFIQLSLLILSCRALLMTGATLTTRGLRLR